MIEKLARAFSKLRGEVSELSQRIDSLPEPKNGRDGVSPKAEDIAALVLEQIPAPKDGVSPKAEDIAALVLEQIPAPKDGKDADAQAIIEEVLAQIPAPKDGKDAQPPALADVAALVFAQMPTPKDGRDGKDGKSPTAQEVAAALPAPERGPQGKEGRPGKDGASITDVKIEKNNTLFVWLNGKKKRAGKIEVPVPSVPQFAAGGGSRESRGQVPADNCQIGLFDYNDLATQTTPINIPSGLVNVDIPNDEQGPFTNKNFAPNGVTDIWDADAGLFDWSQLKLGDMVDIRLDLSVTTTSPNQTIIVELVLAIGGFEYAIPFVQANVKTAGTYPVNRYNGAYMGDDNTLLNGARFRIRSDAAATMVVNGWYCKVLVRG
jgi:hypothetical protein